MVTKDNERTCLANATEVTEYAKQFKLGHWCFCGPGQQKYGVARARTNRTEHGIAQPEHDRFLKKLHIHILLCGTFLEKDIPSPRRANRPFMCKVRPRQRKSSFVIFWHANCFALTSRCGDWYDRYNRNQEAGHPEGRELSTEDFTNPTHRTDQTTSGNRMRKTSEPLLKCHKKQVNEQKLEKASSS